jgi:3-oxoacyl-[acyl-carrier protein] reductase
MKLAQKVAIVTGASQGIGLACAQRLAQEGARVMLTDIRPEVADAASAIGEAARFFCADVSQKADVDALLAETLAAFGQVDILVNNAGVTRDDLIMRMTEEAWREVLETNLFGAFFMTKAVTRPMLKARGGRIINITSVSGQAGQMGQANYSSAKAGILGMTKTLAKEWGRLKVNVNAVAFGLIETRLTQALAGDQSKTVTIEGREIKVGVQQAMLDGVSRMTPLGRAGKPEEAAGAVYLFCTPESNFLSGQVVYCGGGPGGNF